MNNAVLQSSGVEQTRVDAVRATNWCLTRRRLPWSSLPCRSHVAATPWQFLGGLRTTFGSANEQTCHEWSIYADVISDVKCDSRQITRATFGIQGLTWRPTLPLQGQGHNSFTANANDLMIFRRQGPDHHWILKDVSKTSTDSEFHHSSTLFYVKCTSSTLS